MLVFTQKKTKNVISVYPLSPVSCSLVSVPSSLPSQRGFTLLELLLSITILTLVMVAIYETLAIGSRVWEKGEENIDKLQRMRVVMDLLSREIKSAFPYVVTPSELDTHKEFYAFDGKKDSLSFVSGIPLKKGGGGLSWLTVWVEEGEGLVVVERDALRTDIFKERSSINKDEINVLDAYVSRVQFEYYELKGKKEEGEGEGEWRENWDAEKMGTLPHAVRIELTFRGDGEGHGYKAREPAGEYSRTLVVPLMIHSKKKRVVEGEW